MIYKDFLSRINELISQTAIVLPMYRFVNKRFKGNGSTCTIEILRKCALSQNNSIYD